MNKDSSNIVKKAEKYRSLFENLLFAGSKIQFIIYHERTKELVEHGLITHDKDYYINLKIPLYQKYIRSVFYPYHHEEGDYIQRNFNANDYVDTSGILNLDKVIEAYKIYKQQRRFVYFRTQDSKGNFISIPEAAMMYSFETFINGVLGVLKGKSYLEANTALGRTDLLINVRGYEQVIEAKVFKNMTQFEDGKAQLAYYAQHLGLKMAYYLVFADTEVTHSDVLEADEIIEGIRIKTYLVRYELDKDFTAPRKRKTAKPKPKK